MFGAICPAALELSKPAAATATGFDRPSYAARATSRGGVAVNA